LSGEALDLQLGERVVIDGVDEDIDGRSGQNLGRAMMLADMVFYIILLDEPLEENLAVMMPEAVLSRLN
jgi:hypothetical protein